MLTRAGKLLRYAWRDDILPTLQGPTTYIGGACVTFVIVLAVTLVCFVRDMLRGKPAALKGCALFCSVAVAAVLLTMYNIDPRHMSLVVLMMLGAIVAEDARPAAVYLPLLLVLLVPLNFQRGSLPEMNADMAAQMEVVERELTADLADAGSDPWDNTLAYAYDDNVFHGYLYAVPAGMGIEFDKNTYLWDAENPIYSRYVMCGHGTRVEERLQGDGWQPLFETNDLIVYKRP